MYAKFYENGKGFHSDGNLTNYIYCNVCDFLIFISKKYIGDYFYQNGHLKRCITKDISSNEHVRKEILQSIDRRKFQIW